MRALLVQSPATSPWVPRRQWEPPSVGVATIAAQTDRHEVWIADLLVYRMAAPARLLEIIDEYCPQVVGFSSMTFQYHSTLELARMVKEHDGSILTALGGYHATLCHEQITSDKHEADLWDFLIRGEGDFAFGELLDCLDRGGAGLEQVRGLSFKRAGRFHHNPPRPAEDLTRIRIPARGRRVTRGFHLYFRPAEVIETSRGCLHNCNFCSINRMYGRSFRPFPIDRVVEDVVDAYSRGARHILLADDNVTTDMDRLEALCDRIARLKLRKLSFTTQASPIGFAKRPEVARKMAEAGFMSIFLGIENVSTKSLRMMRKPNTLKLIRDGVAAIQRANMIVVAGIINGLPHDDAESIRENYQFIVDMGVTAVMDQVLTPYPATPLRQQLLAENLVDNFTDYRWYDGYFANVRTEHLSADELSFVRWKTRRELIGMWHPTPADWRHFTSYTALWQLGLKQMVWLNERLLELLFGVEGRYRLQMLQYLHLNRFGLGAFATNGPTYHPIFATPHDPYADSKLSVLRRRRQPQTAPPRPAPAVLPERERRQAL